MGARLRFAAFPPGDGGLIGLQPFGEFFLSPNLFLPDLDNQLAPIGDFALFHWRLISGRTRWMVLWWNESIWNVSQWPTSRNAVELSFLRRSGIACPGQGLPGDRRNLGSMDGRASERPCNLDA